MARPNNTRRKLAIASWGPPMEGNIYGKLTVDVGRALEWLAAERERTGQKVSITHLVGRAVAEALARSPGLNGRIRFGRFIPHETVDVTFLVAIGEGADLGKFKVARADQRTVGEIAAELAAGAERLRGGEDAAFEKSKGMLRMMPSWLLRPLVHWTGWLTSVLGVNMPSMGLESFPFGSVIITSVGMFGLGRPRIRAFQNGL